MMRNKIETTFVFMMKYTASLYFLFSIIDISNTHINVVHAFSSSSSYTCSTSSSAFCTQRYAPKKKPVIAMMDDITKRRRSSTTTTTALSSVNIERDQNDTASIGRNDSQEQTRKSYQTINNNKRRSQTDSSSSTTTTSQEDTNDDNFRTNINNNNNNNSSSKQRSNTGIEKEFNFDDFDDNHDYYNDYENDYDINEDDLYEYQTYKQQQQQNQQKGRRIDNNNDYFDDDNYDDNDENYQDKPESWEWETYQQTTHIYLPPQQQQSSTTTPKTILHFIGGTVFGSYPLQFYAPLLEQIGQKSNSIIIATSIPVTFQSNPLNHQRLCHSIAKSFRKAYRNVICDEYGSQTANSMKIVGLGHSLGSRLHCILNTKSSLVQMAFKREGNVLLAFNNYNAYSSIPGLQVLKKNVRETKVEEMERKRKEREERMRVDRQRQQRKRGRRGGGGGDDDRGYYEEEEDYFYDRDTGRRRRRRERVSNYNRRYSNNEDYDYDDDYYDDDEDDIDLDEVVSTLRQGIKSKISSFKARLTPDFQQSSFEFYPTPEDLWSKISGGYYGEHVSKTLVVQFDRDKIDQSARLASSIYDSNPDKELGGKVQEEEEEDGEDKVSDVVIDPNVSVSDVKFARLRGTHLTPVTYVDNFGITETFGRLSALSMDAAHREAIREARRRSKSKIASKRQEMKELDDVVNSIVKYIDTVICPEAEEET